MPVRKARQDGRRCARWLGGLAIVMTVLAVAAVADDASPSNESFLLFPRMIRNPQFADAIVDAPVVRPLVASNPTPRRRLSLDERLKVIKKPTSSRAARKAARGALPLASMTEANRRHVLQIVDGNSLFRELPTYRFEVDPRVYRFFMDHPDVAVGIWRVMQISEFQMRQTGASTYSTDDSAGTSGAITVAYRSDNEAVVCCEGVYKSQFLPTPIQANGALHVQVGFDRAADGRTFATHSARLFVSFPSQTIDTAAKIMSPISNAIIDQNFREVSLFLNMMSVAMQRQPGWVENVSSQLDGALETQRNQLMEVTVEVFADANPQLRHIPRRAE